MDDVPSTNPIQYLEKERKNDKGKCAKPLRLPRHHPAVSINNRPMVSSPA